MIDDNDIPSGFKAHLIAMLPDELKIELLRQAFVKIMKRIESQGYVVTGDDPDLIESELTRFFATDEERVECSMGMLQTLCQISARPSDIEDTNPFAHEEDCPIRRTAPNDLSHN